jgi:hypothetical protein
VGEAGTLLGRRFDAVAAAAAARIKASWQAQGEFPTGVVFAS